ncbi:ATP-binding protein [Vibrio maritimus]|uniref:ATP-binding protein n=1 Tax=Vibrio maritimus TaxID=990268 RepID=UPI001F3CD5E2|nr:ATP-binding protein [Vibrio maritimus]
MSDVTENITNDRPFIRGAVAIESMRDNGYKNAAYALAELIDNSIQAGATNVKLMCFEAVDTSGVRNTRRIKKIGIFDNGKGMSRDVLHLALEFGGSKHRDDPDGMGKFGMGLPNSSISQCKRVDVWSWEKGSTPSHTFLDIGLMQQGALESIPYPSEKPLPTEFSELCKDGGLPDSGTFIVWSNLDRLQWKTAASIYKHSETLVGRMYRKFIAKGKVKIRFEPYLWNEVSQTYLPSDKPTSTDFRANDPIYLSPTSSLPDLPDPMTGESPFEIKQREIVELPYEGSVFKVEILVSMIKQEVINAIKRSPDTKGATLGATIWGKHMATNVGVSVVRADRELETRTDFISKDIFATKSRFMGVEVNFPPGLDKVFGVLNNKQAAVNFQYMNIDEDYEQQGFENVEDYIKDLEENNDPKLKLYKVSDRLMKIIKEVEKEVKAIDVDINSGSSSSINKPRPKSEKIIEQINTRRGEQGKGPDPEEKIRPSDKPEIIKALKRDSSVTEPEAQRLVSLMIENNEHFKIQEVGVAQNIFFDVSTFNGLTLLQLNKNHPFYQKLIARSDENQKELIKVCLGAWARMENEALSERSVRQLQFARELWGQMLHEYLNEDE